MARGRPQPDVSPRRATRGKAQSAAVASAGSLDPAQLWRSLVRHSPDRIVLLDRSGRILYTNHTGSFDSVELVVGSRFDALAANPVRATLRRTLTQLFREGGGQPAHFEIPVVGTSALRWWDGHALPVVERGKVAAVLLVCRDVTERRHTEEALRIQEAQLAEAQGLAHIGSWERNLNDETATWSEELYRIFGLTQSTNLVGRARFYELIHPDDRQRVKQAIEHGVESHEPLNVTYRIRRPDGRIRWIHARGSVVYDDQGRPERTLGTAQDVTERYRAERLLAGDKQVLEALARGGALPDVLTELCRTIEELCDGMLCSILLIEGDGKLRTCAAPSLPPAYNASIDGLPIGPDAGSCGTAAFRRQRVIVSDIETDPLWAKYRALALPHHLRACWSTPILANSGSVLGTFALYYHAPRLPTAEELALIDRSVSIAGVAIERRQSENAIAHSRAQLRALAGRLRSAREQERTDIARGIHDELGTALTTLKLDLSWLRARLRDHAPLAEKTRAMIDVVDATINKTRRLATELRPAVLDELGLVPAIEWETRQFALRTGIRCSLHVSAGTVPLDPERSTDVFRILQEALTNVMRHAEAHVVRVGLEVTPRDLLLTVEDDGRGIRPTDVTDARSLGLLGMRERALAWSGEVLIAPGTDGGTLVSARIPAGPDVTNPPPPPS